MTKTPLCVIGVFFNPDCLDCFVIAEDIGDVLPSDWFMLTSCKYLILLYCYKTCLSRLFGNIFAVISLTTCLLSRWQPFQPEFIANEWRMSNKSPINTRQHNYCTHCDHSVPARRFSVEPSQHFNTSWGGMCWKPRSEETFVTAFRKWWVQLFNRPAVPTTHPPQIRLLYPPHIIVWHLSILCCAVNHSGFTYTLFDEVTHNSKVTFLPLINPMVSV